MQKVLVVVDMQNDFIDGALGTKEAVAIVPGVNQEIGSLLPLVGDFQDFAVGGLGNGIGRGGGEPRIAESGHDLIPLCISC